MTTFNNANELRDFIIEQRKKNPDYLAYCKRTEDFGDIPKDVGLYYGLRMNYISTWNYNTKNKNLNLNFDYSWSSNWHTNYKGKFILIENEVKEEEVEVIKTIPSVIKYKNKLYDLRMGQEVFE